MGGGAGMESGVGILIWDSGGKSGDDVDTLRAQVSVYITTEVT